MQNPANLQVYHRAIELAVSVHHVARRVSNRQAPGLSRQLGRAAASIPANISEGVGHPAEGRCPFHLGVSIASGFEVETHLRLAQRLCPRLGDITPLFEELDQVRRMTYSLREHKLKQLAEKRRASQQRSPSP